MTVTMLYHGVPAVYRNGYWVVISARFDELARIEESKLNDPETYAELMDRGFFNCANASERVPVAMATLITTSDCNLRCKYCFANAGDSCYTMTERIAFAAVRRAVSNARGKRLAIAFFGGEPSLTPDLIKSVVEYTDEQAARSDIKDVVFTITTNGLLSQDLLKFIIGHRFVVTLSADGPPFIQDYQRPLKSGGKSSLLCERTIRALAANGLDFKVRATVTDFSVKHLAETVAWLQDIGGTQLHVEPLSIAGRAALATRGEALQRPEAEEFAVHLQAAIIRGNELGVGIISSSYMNLLDPPQEFCDGNVQNRFAVTYGGDVTSCVEVQDKCHPIFPQFIVGRYDLHQDELVTIKERRDRACIVSIESNQSTCYDCFAQRICAGGCPVRNFHVTGDSARVDPYRCELIRRMVPFVFGLLDDSSEGG